MSRRREQESEGNTERWLLTYSDMITLLLALFIMLYTISSLDQGKYQALSTQLGIAFNGGNSIFETGYPSGGGTGGASGAAGTSPSPDIGSVATGQPYTQEDIERQVSSLIDSNGLSPSVNVSLEERGVVVSFQDALLFATGSADPTSKSLEMLKKLSVIVSQCKNYIRVEGSADDVPISNGQFASNWELAAQRAINVAKSLIVDGVDASRISATSYGEYRPIAANDTAEHRKLNRRVDIVFVNEAYNNNEPGSEKQNP